MIHTPLDGFDFHGQLAAFRLRVTLDQHASSPINFLLTLFGADHTDDRENKFSCGSMVTLHFDLALLAGVELILERVIHLSPVTLDEDCLVRLSDSLKEWYASLISDRVRQPNQPDCELSSET